MTLDHPTDYLRALPGDDVRQILWRFSDRYDLQMLVQSARAVDRNLLRMAVAELIGFKSTPFPVVINEALEIGRRYCAPESSNFLNGVLDSIARSLIGK